MTRKSLQSDRPPATVTAWLPSPLSPEVKTAIERLARADDVARIAVMPDVHLAAGVCVGNGVATTRLIYPQAVGGDIGCGMLAAAFDAEADLLRRPRDAERLFHALHRDVPTMRHRSLESAPPLPADLADTPPGGGSLAAAVRREGRIELGTLGRGNHFVEFQADEENRLWLMLHSGSRYMGQAISELHARAATRAAAGLYHLDSESPAGQAYLADVAWGQRYADANRRRMLAAIADVMQLRFGAGLLPESLIATDHNHVRREQHGDYLVFVHRKGAMSAREGEPGVIPGTMGTHSFHVLGRGCAAALHSSSHGAGRKLSRTDARSRISPRKLAEQLDGIWYDRQFATRLCEEAPSAYKDIDAVFRAQRDLTRIVRRLRPVLVYKGV